MSLNKLVRQSISLMEGLATMPFQVVQELWGDESSKTGKIIKQTAFMSEQLAAMPFRLAREIFSDGASEMSSYRLRLPSQGEKEEAKGQEDNPPEQT